MICDLIRKFEMVTYKMVGSVLIFGQGERQSLQKVLGDVNGVY